MDRKTKILFRALSEKDAMTMRHLNIPKWESFEGLSERDIEILLKKPLQSPEVSSTKKSYIYKTRTVAKKRLFNESDDDNKENNTDNVNIISVDVTSSVTSPYQQIESSTSEPFQSSEDEYVPNYAEESTSSRDTSLSIEIHEMPRILVNSQSMELLYGQNNVAKNCIQQNDDEQVGQNTNGLYFQDNFFHDNPIQIDQNVKKQVQTNKNGATTKKRIWNKRDYCFFCDTEVLKFSRHVLRHHGQEIEVQQILAYNVKDRKRKNLFNKLRNQGNFLKSTMANTNFIPVETLEITIPRKMYQVYRHMCLVNTVKDFKKENTSTGM
ncbi:hypothetical protein JTB14_012689 [Gonioctena quinquepunctata]|nr:hypothetical protein JTB14_012689 [Gonioctena quinquepunctata]